MVAGRRQYILVDGYNVAHAWPQLRQLLSRDLDAAAAQLAASLSILHDGESSELTIVFDGKGERADTSNPGGPKAPCIIYSPAGLSADAIIEQIVSRAPEPDCFTVATRDNALRLSVFARGAHVISPEELLEWQEREQRSIGRELGEQRRKNDHKFGNKLF